MTTAESPAPAPSAPAGSLPRRIWRLAAGTAGRRLWTLALVSIAVRAIAALTVAVVHPDGARDLRMARLLLEGRFLDSLTIYPLTHPLHPILTALLGFPFRDLLFVGAAVSVVLSGLSVIPLFLMSKAAWDEQAAAIASLLYGLLPAVVELHCEPLTEGPFMFFFFSAMALSWSAIEKKSWERAILAGACMTLAWLTRPEGAYLPLLFLLACVLRRSRFVIPATALAFAVAFVLAYPYLAFIKAQTGRWALSASPFSQGILGLLTGETQATGYIVDEKTAQEFGEYRDIATHGKFLGPAVHIAKALFLKDLFYVLGPFLILGFFCLRPPEKRWGPALYLLAAAGGFFIPPVLAFVAATPFSHRYILVTAALLLPVVALGARQAAAWTRRTEALPILIGVICVAMAVSDFRPKRTSKTGLKEAGRAILKELGPDRRILASERQVEYYARGEYIELLPDLTFAQLLKTVEEQKIDSVAFYVPNLRNLEPGIEEKASKAFALLGEYPSPPAKKKSPVRVYVTRRR